MIRQLDVRGLPPCEPFERILEAVDALSEGDALEVLIHREPFPLYDWLTDHGFAYQQNRVGEAAFRLVIIARAH